MKILITLKNVNKLKKNVMMMKITTIEKKLLKHGMKNRKN